MTVAENEKRLIEYLETKSDNTKKVIADEINKLINQKGS